MDTPNKTPSTQPSPSSFLSKFEDSPVFNFISTLSPIKPLSVGHCPQPFHLLGFSSPQAFQTPPTLPKEPKLTRKNYATDVPKNNFSQNGCEIKTEIVDAIEPSDLQSEDANRIDKEVNISLTEKSSDLVSDISRSLKYVYDTPENNGVQCDALKSIHENNVSRREILPVNTIPGNSKESDLSCENAMGFQETRKEQNKETSAWDNFVCEASDIFNCHSPTGESYNEEVDDRCIDPGMLSFISTVLQPPNELTSDQQQMESACSGIPKNHHIEVPMNKIEVGNSDQVSSASNASAVLAEEVVHYVRTEVDDKSCSQQQQTTRRRCLVYEMSASRYRKILADSTGGSPDPTKPTSNPNTSNDKTFTRPGSNKFSSALPGIGLHLNALAAASKDKIIVKRQTLTCRRQLISSSSTPSFDSVISDAKPASTETTPEIVVKEEPSEHKDGVHVSVDAFENSILDEGIIKLPQNSPKKKRQKTDNLGDTESCKRCNCKRSKCLKLYCECFAAGLYCVEPCNCQDCFNKPIHEDTVLETRRQIESRNPLAFAPKVIRSSSTPNTMDELKTPASAWHKRGCNCKKSGCLKKYCECFQGGVGCSLSCRCEGCKNTFGYKEGPESIVYQETKFLQRNASDVTLLDSVPGLDVENHDQETPDLPKIARQPLRRPFHFGGMIPHFPTLPSDPFPLSSPAQRINETDKTAFEEDHDKIEDVAAEDAPETLKGDYLLPNTYVKSASPNCKRISPPHCDFKTSPTWKSCRKLILRSIPPLPNFEPDQESTEVSGKIQ